MEEGNESGGSQVEPDKPLLIFYDGVRQFLY